MSLVTQGVVNTEFELYRAKCLNRINHSNINDKNIANFYEFIINELYDLYLEARAAHNSFFWALRDPNNPTDEEFLRLQAKFWGIPFFSFEPAEDGHIRMVREGLDFVWKKGTVAQTKKILDLIFKQDGGEWDYNTYSDKDNISIDVQGLTDEKRMRALEYLEDSIPPYIKVEIFDYILNWKDKGKRYSYDEICDNGGGDFIKQKLADFITSAYVLPHESFTLDKSKLNKALLKIAGNNPKEGIRTIVLILKSDITLIKAKTAFESFFLNNTAEIIILNSNARLIS